jgi:CRISPR-associated protein Cas2
MSPAVRERVWGVMCEWHKYEPHGSLVMIWRDMNSTGGVGIANLGTPARELVEADGMWLVRRGQSAEAL